MERFVSPLRALFSGLAPSSAATVTRPQWQRHFDACGVRGTFVLYEPAADRYLVCNEARARQRYIPASTFEIAGALIGLEVGSITDENEVFHWDGRPKPVPAWERDHSVASALRDGAVWMFQEVARRTGRERMKEWLARLDYGNRDIAGGIDLFWLQGELRVSAFEQVDFLRRLSEGELAMSQRVQRLVRSALAVERTSGYTLYAKSGSSRSALHPVSWWIGWIERKGRPAAYFALNLAPTPRTRREERFAIARAILAETGTLPSGARPS